MSGTSPLTGKPESDIPILGERLKEVKEDTYELHCNLVELKNTLNKFITDWHSSRLEAVQRSSELSHAVLTAQTSANTNALRITDLEKKVDTQVQAIKKEIKDTFEKLEVKVDTQRDDYTKLSALVGKMNESMDWIKRGVLAVSLSAIGFLIVETLKLLFHKP